MSHDPAPPVENFHFWTGRHCQQCGLKIYGEEVAAQTIREHCGCQPMPIPTPPAPQEAQTPGQQNPQCVFDSVDGVAVCAGHGPLIHVGHGPAPGWYCAMARAIFPFGAGLGSVAPPASRPQVEGFAGRPASEQGFAGLPQHLQPRNLPQAGQSARLKPSNLPSNRRPPHPQERAPALAYRRDALVEAIDMIAADRLRNLAANIAQYGSDITAWADVRFIVKTLHEIADQIEAAVKSAGVPVRSEPVPKWTEKPIDAARRLNAEIRGNGEALNYPPMMEVAEALTFLLVDRDTLQAQLDAALQQANANAMAAVIRDEELRAALQERDALKREVKFKDELIWASRESALYKATYKAERDAQAAEADLQQLQEGIAMLRAALDADIASLETETGGSQWDAGEHFAYSATRTKLAAILPRPLKEEQ